MAAKFTPRHFFIRFLFAFVLVCASYNPIKPYSFYEWVIAPGFLDYTVLSPIHGLAGIILLIVWVIFLRATSRSLGLFGIILSGMFLTMLVWVVVDQGWVSLENSTSLTWIIIVTLSALLALGMSWSHIRRRLSGQLDVDETDEH